MTAEQVLRVQVARCREALEFHKYWLVNCRTRRRRDYHARRWNDWYHLENGLRAKLGRVK